VAQVQEKLVEAVEECRLLQQVFHIQAQLDHKILLLLQ
jgi:hypothetical protein